MQRVYKENEWGKVSKRIVTHAMFPSTLIHLNKGLRLIIFKNVVVIQSEDGEILNSTSQVRVNREGQ